MWERRARLTGDFANENTWNGLDADPNDPIFVFVGGINFLISTDGGASFSVRPGSQPHADHQGFATDPTDPSIIYTVGDGGIYRSPRRGLPVVVFGTAVSTWTFIGNGMANVEFYDHANASTNPDLVIGGTQDNGTLRYDGSSTAWKEIWGGDGGTVDIDSTNEKIQNVMNQGVDSMRRINVGSGSRCIGCTFPVGKTCFNLHFQSHPVNTSIMLASCEDLWRSNNPQCSTCPNWRNGSSGTAGVWSRILSGISTGGNIRRSTIDGTTDLYYAGTSVGELWAGPSGASFRKIFTPTGPFGVTDLELDPDNPAIIYVATDNSSGDRIYRIRRTSLNPTLANTTAQAITSNLPTNLVVQTLAVDRMASFTVYAGTNRGVYRGVSRDSGATWVWTSFSNGMPAAADVRDLEVHPVTGVMRAATFGRSAYEVNTDFPIGSLLAADGRITLLRVHDVGTGFGPPTDSIDVEVVIALDSMPGKAFGFQMRNDAAGKARRDMFDVLRQAFKTNRPVRIDYVRTGLRNGRIIRVTAL
jgi:hypothetical protein